MYSFRELKMKNGSKKLLIDFEDEKKELLSTFLETEVTIFSDNIIQCLERVMANQSEYEEFNGNICGVEIYAEKTEIFDNLADDGKGNWCEINTKDLKKLIDIWQDKYQIYKETGNYS